MICVVGLVSGCQTTGGHCDGWKPIRMTQATVDRMARENPAALRAIVGHNEHGRDTCGWRGRK